MKLSNGALVAVVDGEKLALFKNKNASDIKLTPLETPAIADRVSGSAGRRSNEANPDNDTQAEDGFAMGVAEVPANEVGLAILGPLRDLDEVAYLRFASVYRNFDSLADFEDAIADLRGHDDVPGRPAVQPRLLRR